MKKFSLVLALVMVLSLLSGCAGTAVVYYSDCTCPTGSHDVVVSETTVPASEPEIAAEGAVKTGLAVVVAVGAADATAEENGEVDYDVTYVAVNVDDNGIITACKIDSLGATVSFDAAGTITSENGEVKTKQELGYDYGMVAYQASTMEWFEQADALAAYAVGKTAEELCSVAVDETGYAADVDLASSATIYLGSYVDAIQVAVNNAQYLGAQAGDELKLASTNKLSDGNLNSDAVALTMKDGVITSCALDSLQATVTITDGAVTIGNTMTKNELGYDYGMVAYQASSMEWFEQAAGFAAYVTGKTADEVAGIAVDESTYPTDADLTASCTIAIGGFQALIAKAAQ